MATLATVSNYTQGVSGLLMAIPQLNSLLSKSVSNTIGYQPQKGTSVNPPALIFQYEGDQTATLDSDITDHWVENNSAIQDQIAIKPVTITTHGFVGELTDTPANPILAALQVAANKLLLVEALTPQLTLSAIDAYNQASFAYSQASKLANSAISAFKTIASGPSGEAVINQFGIQNTTSGAISSLNSFGVTGSAQSKQQVYFQQFYAYWLDRTLFTVQTPWAVFENMAIKSLRAIQDADTSMITDFEVTFKMIKFADVASSSTEEQSNINANPESRLYYSIQPNVSSNVSLSNSLQQVLP